MTFAEAQTDLDHLWQECYAQAKDEVRGNWQDPGVMRRRRERATELADARVAASMKEAMSITAEDAKMMRAAEFDASENGLSFQSDAWFLSKTGRWLNQSGTIMMELDKDGVVSMWQRKTYEYNRVKPKLRSEKADKPLTHRCFHYFDDSREGQKLVGTVWQSDAGGLWSGHCTTGVEEGLYGHLGDFDYQHEAVVCLKRRLLGDKTAKGRNAD